MEDLCGNFSCPCPSTTLRVNLKSLWRFKRRHITCWIGLFCQTCEGVSRSVWCGLVSWQYHLASRTLLGKKPFWAYIYPKRTMFPMYYDFLHSDHTLLTFLNYSWLTQRQPIKFRHSANMESDNVVWFPISGAKCSRGLNHRHHSQYQSEA